jgi:ketosteroid isomerase-like protein
VTATLDVRTVQQALDALITRDAHAAAQQFTDDLVMTGVGGCFAGRTVGREAVLARFADVAVLTQGTFGTEVEAVFSGSANQVVVLTRHWAAIDGNPVRGTQALVVTVDGGRIRIVDVLSPAGAASGIWS